MAVVDTGDYGMVQPEDGSYPNVPVGDIDSLITALSAGIGSLPATDAISEITRWSEQLVASDVPAVASVGADLSALRDALADSDTGLPTIGEILLSLGAGVGAIGTGHQDADLGDKLGHLATLLTEAGQSLSSEDAGLDGVSETDAAGGSVIGNPTTTRGSAPFANQ